jgi:hypothetical protein
MGAPAVRVEPPPVVRTFETTVDNATVAQPGIAMRATVGENIESRRAAHDDDALAQKVHAFRCVERKLIGAPDG